MKIDKRNPVHWWLLILQCVFTLVALPLRAILPSPTRPVIVLYGHQLAGNLKALYDYWQENLRDSYDCYYLSLDPNYSQQLATHGVNVLRCNRLLDMCQAMRCQAMVTDHGLHAMLPIAYLGNITLVDVWHGIPFKGFVPEDFKLQHRYRETWVSSRMLAKMYVERFGFTPGQVRALGYARTDKLFRNVVGDPSFRSQAGLAPNQSLVLYAPTWQQDADDRELFPFEQTQADFIRRLGETCRAHEAVLVIRSHLNARIDQQGLDNVIYCSMRDFADTESLLLETDVLVCDWSSIAFDYLATDRPAIFLDVPPPFANGFSLGPEYRYGAVVGDMDALCRQLNTILDEPANYRTDYAAKHRDVCAAIYDEHTDGGCAARQWQRLGVIIGCAA